MSNEQLWAPWRLPYILKAKAEEPAGCFLCRASESPHEAENQVVARTELTVTVLNRFPYNNGHLLVAPRRHQGTLADLDDAELLGCMQELRRMTQILQHLMAPNGYNVGLNLGSAAGAGLPGHLHWHLVPRWNGDTNFMSVCGAVDVIPQSLTALYDLLRDALARGLP